MGKIRSALYSGVLGATGSVLGYVSGESVQNGLYSLSNFLAQRVPGGEVGYRTSPEISLALVIVMGIGFAIEGALAGKDKN